MSLFHIGTRQTSIHMPYLMATLPNRVNSISYKSVRLAQMPVGQRGADPKTMQFVAPPTELVAGALRACRRHFIAVAAFSALLNLLFLVPMLYMLQVYDRVIPTRGSLTLFFLTLVLLFGLITLALLDFVRSRLLVRASIRLDRQLAGVLLDTSLARRDRTFDAVARQAMREFDMLRQALTGPAIIALCDAPWSPIYILDLLPDPSVDRLAGACRRGGAGVRRAAQRERHQRTAANAPARPRRAPMPARNRFWPAPRMSARWACAGRWSAATSPSAIR